MVEERWRRQPLLAPKTAAVPALSAVGVPGVGSCRWVRSVPPSASSGGQGKAAGGISASRSSFRSRHQM